ncbi:hypothetical protein [Pectobacterium brasiliense]|uniref:hypothetical protein n=1 Tax=Pectobacterium brasiliense TaxID=180957 RepID=UPI0039867F29
MSKNLSYMLNFLYQIKNHPDILSYRKVELSEDYGASLGDFRPIMLSIGSDNRMSANRVIMDLCLFMLIDALIDRDNPDLIGEDFTTKYKKINAEKTHTFIQKECFRLIRLIRNAIVHDNEGISFEDEFKKIKEDEAGIPTVQDTRKMLVNLKSKKKDEKLDMYLLGKEYLDFIIWFLVFEQNPQGYSLLILKSAYNKLISNINSISDRMGDSINECPFNSSSVLLKGFHRYVIFNAFITEGDEDVRIKIKEYCSPCCDYYWEIDTDVYLIPLEALVVDKEGFGVVNKNQLSEYKASKIFLSKYLNKTTL